MVSIENAFQQIIDSESTANKNSQSESDNSNNNNNNQLLKDDYGLIDLEGTETITIKNFKLENGIILPEAPVNYKTYGNLNKQGDNVLLICHALTGYSCADKWWGDLFGSGKAFDPSKYFIICPNILGSCYGTCGPTTINPLTNKPYASSFPHVTIRDAVNLQYELIKSLNINKLIVIGGSLGGMQALEWTLSYPSLVLACVALSCPAQQTAWQISINHVQRQCIYSDPDYKGGLYPQGSGPINGLSLARQLAMITYRTHQVYQQKYERTIEPSNQHIFAKLMDNPSPSPSPSPSPNEIQAKAQAKANDKDISGLEYGYNNNNNNNSDNNNNSGDDNINVPNYSVSNYLRYQGHKLVSRFDANSYITLTHMLDSHDVGAGPNRDGVIKALSSINQPVLIMGIDSDVLYPLAEQEFIARHIRYSKYRPIHSNEGHDGFILAQYEINLEIKKFLDELNPQSNNDSKGSFMAEAEAPVTASSGLINQRKYDTHIIDFSFRKPICEF